MNKNKILRVAANEFAEKACKLSSPLEIAIVGSVAGNDPYPNDLDLAIIIRNLDEIATVAKYARQMSRHYHGWEVFLFNKGLTTFQFIKKNKFKDTLNISEMLLNDKHDLIHKAVGWMLREIGKRDQETEERFLKKYYKKMPRTMLRYAIERFDEKKRNFYLKN